MLDGRFFRVATWVLSHSKQLPVIVDLTKKIGESNLTPAQRLTAVRDLIDVIIPILETLPKNIYGKGEFSSQDEIQLIRELGDESEKYGIPPWILAIVVQVIVKRFLDK